MTIKRSPEDFRVEEVLSDSFKRSVRPGPGLFALYRLTKSGLTTPDAVLAVARALDLHGSVLTTAGLKDKHALTIQHLAVELGSLPRGKTLPDNFEGEGWTLQRAGSIDRPLDASAIAANRFLVVVRGLSSDASARMEERAALLSTEREGQGASLRVVNYFGDQRFGSSRHLAGFPARLLVQGRYEEALRLAIATEARKDDRRKKERVRLIVARWGKWGDLRSRLPRGCPERAAVEKLAAGGDFRAAFVALPYFYQRMIVQAYQSWLWNETAREFLLERFPSETLVVYEGRFGTMVFPQARSILPELVGLDLPVLGYKSELLQPWKAAAERVLAREGIGSTADLRIRGVRRPFFGVSARQLFIDAENFELSHAQPDTSGERGRCVRRVSFELPRGAYATVVLRALGQ